METLFKEWTSLLAMGIEASAALIIGLAAVEATVKALIHFFRRRPPQQNIDSIHRIKSQETKEEIRLQLGRWLALGLEFELAADILLTAVAPTWNEIGQLAAIVVLRTVLNYFLQKEIEKADQRRIEEA